MSAPNPVDPVVLESIGIINALRRGTVPASGLSRFTVGLESEEQALRDQFRLVAHSGADIKAIRGEYGSGKTFLISRALEIAREEGFVTARVAISPINPLHKLSTIYSRMARSLVAGGEENAIRSVIDGWLYAVEERVREYPGLSADESLLKEKIAEEVEKALGEIGDIHSALAAVIRTYYYSSDAGDFQTARAAVGWFAGEANIGRAFRHQAGIKGEVDESSVTSFMKVLSMMAIGAGYKGCVLALDELEITQSLPRNLRERGYRNLVQLIDALDGGSLPHWFIIMGGTPLLYDGPRGMRSVPPLFERIGQVPGHAGFSNPRQTQIVLKSFDARKLEEVALRVTGIYATAYGEVDRDRISHRFIHTMVERVCSHFGGRVDVVPRIFLREFVDLLDKCDIYPEFDPMISYDLSPDSVKSVLTEEEKAVIRISW
ncbi:MAG: BREX system ATP-binding protein BrxD [Methanospirillum sp.]|nr:BREX system ATP-binding protein BrxD [Methanospirillum sp.]